MPRLVADDDGGLALRRMQWQAHRQLDALYADVARQADLLLRRAATSHPVTGEPQLTDAGREHALVQIGRILDRTDAAAIRVIERATAAAARLGSQR